MSRSCGRGTAVRFVRVTTLGAAAVVALAGCSGNGDDVAATSGGSASQQVNGFEKDSADQVLAKAKQAAQGATSVHMLGGFDEGGNSLKIDMVLSKEKGGHGTVTID